MRIHHTLAAATAIAAFMPALASAQTELIFNSYLPPFDETYQVAIRDFAERIEAESGGSIEITIPDSSLAPSDRQYEMVRDGIADMAVVASDSVSQYVTLNAIADLPLNSPTAEAASVALWETYNEHFLPFDEYQGVKVLGTYVLPGRQILSFRDDVVVEAPSDLQGVKIWASAGNLTEVAQALGAIPVQSEFGEVQEYVTKGNVDGIFMTPGSASGANVLDRATSYTTVPGGLGSISFAVFISNERWAELDEEQQQAILRAAEGLSGRVGAASDEEEEALHDVVSQIPNHVPEGENLAAFESVLDAQIEDWKERASEAGLENPDEVLEFYRSVLDRVQNAEG